MLNNRDKKYANVACMLPPITNLHTVWFQPIKLHYQACIRL